MDISRGFILWLILIAVLVLALIGIFVLADDVFAATPTSRNTPTLAPTACAGWPGTCEPTPTPIFIGIGPTPTPQPTEFWKCQVDGAHDCIYWHTINRCGDPTAEPFLREWIIDVYRCSTGDPAHPQCLCERYIPCPASTPTPTATPIIPYNALDPVFLPLVRSGPAWVICLSGDCPWPPQP